LHAIGLTANLVLLALYAVAGAHIDNAGAKSRLYWVLGGAALLPVGKLVVTLRLNKLIDLIVF
jgi:hypothetical protein